MFNIIKITDVDSTNNYALSLQKEKFFREGLVVIADFQTQGRGQRGHKWYSHKGLNLTFSLVVESKITIERQFDLVMIASLSIRDLLLSLGIKSYIKWPNDILVNKQKISGILIDNIISKGIITYSIIGIGLNINQRVFEDYSPKATSLSLQLNKSLILKDIQDKLLNCVKNRLDIYRSGISIKEEYLTSIFQKDRVTVFESNLERFNGIIRDVTEDGLLIVETNNFIKRFNLKEIKMLF